MTDPKDTKGTTPEPASPPPDDSASGSTTSQTAQATAAATAAVTAVRERLVAGEQFTLAASAGIVLVYLIWQFLLDYRVFIDSFPVVLAVLTVLAIWVHRWGHYDFGKGYRILIAALGVSLALFALISLLAWARAGGGSGGDFMFFLGRILYWASGVAAFVGAWQVFRTREA